MKTEDFRHRDHSDFYESAKHIVADILEKATLEKIGFIQKPDNPELLGEHVHVGYVDEFETFGSQNKEIKPLDTSVLEKIGSFAYFEEFISDNLLEKAWKMPWGWGKKEDFKPILNILDGNSRIERDREVVEEILEFHCWNLRNKTYCPKDWRDFK